MDQEGEVLTTQGARTVKGFEATLGKLQRLFDARAKARGGDAAAEIDVALSEGELGMIAFDEAKKRLGDRKLTDAQKVLLADLELGSMITDLQNAKDEAAQRALMKRIADSAAGGQLPADGEKKEIFLRITLNYAVNEEDPDLAQKAFDALKPIYEEMSGKDNPRLQEWMRRVEDKIAEMRSAKKEGCGSDEGMEEGCGEESGDK
ncbi:MAG: hypothetical protein L6Q95_04310 [Planctomycetes bacterium]|nr:hypothetical protein [Planctomycetota bacterium]